jgi:hypothetical protein
MIEKLIKKKPIKRTACVKEMRMMCGLRMRPEATTEDCQFMEINTMFGVNYTSCMNSQGECTSRKAQAEALFPVGDSDD